ncbi:MAG: SRPBCC family protein [Trueperaceae bacterium]
MTVAAEEINPKLDLVLERFVDVPRELVWRAWTEPEHLKQWFAPRPWSTVRCEIDLRPGGIFKAVMRSPEGQEFDDDPGCYLEIVHLEKLVWTSVLLPGFRPKANPGDLDFTAVISMEARGGGTQYTARAIHGDLESAKKHAEMGFHEGWGVALDQLVAHAKTM